MSAETLRALEDAIAAHHRATAETDESASAIITAWVVGYEVANMVDVPDEHGGSVMGYANSYVTSDSSPNTLAHIAHWTGDVVSGSLGPFEDEGS